MAIFALLDTHEYGKFQSVSRAIQGPTKAGRRFIAGAPFLTSYRVVTLFRRRHETFKTCRALARAYLLRPHFWFTAVPVHAPDPVTVPPQLLLNVPPL
jgi:hypothetical protein